MFEESVSVPSIWASMNSWFTPTVLFVLLNLTIGTIFFSSSLANQKQQKPSQDDPQQPKSPSILQRLKSINLYSHRSQQPHPSPPISTRFKQTPDSNTHYPPEQIHQHQTLETETHYFFEQTHHLQQQNLEPETQYVFDQIHQQQILETETQYFFEQTHLHQQNLELETQYVFDQINQQQTLETEKQYLLEQTHEGEEEDGEPQTLDEVYSHITDRHVSSTKSDTNMASGQVPEKLPQKMRKSASLKSALGHFEENDIVEARRPATVRERKSRVTEVDDEVDAKADDFINKFKQQLQLQRLDSISRYNEVISRASGK